MRNMIKRLFDIVSSTVLIIVLIPIFVAVYIMTSVKLGKPAVFNQKRPGKNGRIFTLYKFRSMTSETDSEGTLLPDEQRLTSYGQMLRRTSLDELPQLFNILKGDMSFIGPRPLMVEYLERYSPEQARRHEVKPGITGWAQINGRNNITWEEKFKLDTWYVDHWNLLLDIKIFFLTAVKVLKHEGISLEGEATTTEFMGNREE